MKEKILMAIAIVSLILSITAVTLGVRYNTTQIEPSKIKGVAWTSENDGSNSGLDTDTIDGLESSQFLRNDESGKLKGDLYVEGNISYQAVTKNYKIPFCSFSSSQVDNTNSDSSLKYPNTILGEHYFFRAPINLPNGSIMKKITILYYNNDPMATAECSIYRIGTDGSWGLVTIQLKNNSAISTISRTLDRRPYYQIDNENNCYIASLSLRSWEPSADIRFVWLDIEYTVTY